MFGKKEAKQEKPETQQDAFRKLTQEQKDEFYKRLAKASRQARYVIMSKLPSPIVEDIIFNRGAQAFPYKPCPCGSGLKFKFCCYRGG